MGLTPCSRKKNKKQKKRMKQRWADSSIYPRYAFRLGKCTAWDDKHSFTLFQFKGIVHHTHPNLIIYSPLFSNLCSLFFFWNARVEPFEYCPTATVHSDLAMSHFKKDKKKHHKSIIKIVHMTNALNFNRTRHTIISCKHWPERKEYKWLYSKWIMH